jgi:putative tryptophan/tyrosine transport system substrate-binding protein
MSNRRQFITLLGGAAAAWPIAARGQQAGTPVVGYLHPGTPEMGAYLAAAFRNGLSEAGFVEGRNVAIEYRWAHNERSRVPEFAAEFVRHRVSIIVAATLNTALAVKAATTTIPIVFNATGDPVATGLVASLNRPGGNATGLSSLGGELGAKRLGLLHELVPDAGRFALLVNRESRYAQSMIEETRAMAAAIGGQIEAFTAGTAREIDAAFASLVQKRVEALVVGLSALFDNRRVQMTTLAAHHRLPAIYALRDFVEVGGLMSYGASYTDNARQLGIYTGRILKGEKPADLPVMQPTKFELVINLQTARTLGIEVPPTLLATADEVIE